MDSYVYCIGGTKDHIHIACTLPRTINQSDFLKKLKATSSQWMKEQGVKSFFWQKGYGALSIGQSQLFQLMSYINNQEEHHKKFSFQDATAKSSFNYQILKHASYKSLIFRKTLTL